MGTGPRPADDLVEVAAGGNMVLPFKLFICRRVHAFGRKGAPGLVPLLGVSPDNHGTIGYWFMAFGIVMRIPFFKGYRIGNWSLGFEEVLSVNGE